MAHTGNVLCARAAFCQEFMALFGRDRLPARSTLSRFLAALKLAPVEVLRTLFLEDLVARPLEKEENSPTLSITLVGIQDAFAEAIGLSTR